MRSAQDIIADFKAQGLTVDQGEDKPNQHYAPEIHERTLLYTVAGSLEIELSGQPRVELRKGDLFEVPEGVEHEAWVGKSGWKYITGYDAEAAKKYET